ASTEWTQRTGLFRPAAPARISGTPSASGRERSAAATVIPRESDCPLRPWTITHQVSHGFTAFQSGDGQEAATVCAAIRARRGHSVPWQDAPAAGPCPGPP